VDDSAQRGTLRPASAVRVRLWAHQYPIHRRAGRHGSAADATDRLSRQIVLQVATQPACTVLRDTHSEADPRAAVSPVSSSRASPIGRSRARHEIAVGEKFPSYGQGACGGAYSPSEGSHSCTDRNHDTARGPDGPCSVAARSATTTSRWCAALAVARPRRAGDAR
jgi:hypothetical protein